MPIILKKKVVEINCLNVTGCTIPADRNSKIKFNGNMSQVKNWPVLKVDDKFIHEKGIAQIHLYLKCCVCNMVCWNTTVTRRKNYYTAHGDTLEAGWLAPTGRYGAKAIKYDGHYALFCKDKDCHKIYTMTPFSYEDRIEKSKKCLIPEELESIVSDELSNLED